MKARKYGTSTFPHKRLRNVHFVSLGCPKNRVDTEVMAGIAAARGLRVVSEPGGADMIVVNTCAFIESAKQESIDTLLSLAPARVKGRAKLLVAAGCLSQRYAKQIAAELPEVTHWLGAANLTDLERVLDGVAGRVEVGPPGHFLQSLDTPRLCEPSHHSAYLKIADGCSRQCAFCAIPSIRGKARSRSVHEIVSEAYNLAGRGIKELCLVAQDTGAYGKDRGDRHGLPELLGALHKVNGIQWIRLHYLYPDSVTDALLYAMRDLPKVVAYIDAPIQHASADVLKRMRRGHGPERLTRLIERARDIIPDVFLRTSVLVGHPGESEAQFDELMAFLTWARFDHLGAFRYSDEEGTRSFGGRPAVSARDSYDRFRKVMALGRRISRERNQRLKGAVVEVLVEGPADQQGYVLVGRHRGQAPEVDGATYLVSCQARVGEIIRARIIKTGAHDLVAEPV
jgi:ribosomal protein S12 methylthiotransferase